MDEINAMQAIATQLEKLDQEARARVLAWANAKFAGSFATASPAPAASPHAAVPKAAPVSKTKSSGKAPKKAKSVISMNKALNLTPSGKKSALQFQSDKSPTSAIQKCVVAAYYLREVIEIEAITVSDVLTFFKTVGWKIPSDLKNTLQQAGSKGWLDTSDGDDIKITSMGENLVEHDLPAKSA